MKVIKIIISSPLNDVGCCIALTSDDSTDAGEFYQLPK